jgi:hypothetical protein
LNSLLHTLILWAPVEAGLLLAWAAYSLSRISRNPAALISLGVFVIFAVGAALITVFPPTFAVGPDGRSSYIGSLPEASHDLVFPVLTVSFLVGTVMLAIAAARVARPRT